MSATPASAPKLAVRERVGYAFGDFASCLVWQSVSLFLLFYCTNVAGIENAAAVSIISISKLLDGVTDILMGFIIDRTKSRFGKVRPYLLTMALPLALSTVLLFSVPGGLGVHGKLIWIFVWYNMVTTVFYTAFNVPYSSMHLFLTDDSKERQSLSILRLVFAFGSQVIINWSMLHLVRLMGGGEVNSQRGWTLALIVIGTAVFLLGLLTFSTTKERVGQADTGRSVSIGKSITSIARNKYLLILLGVSFLSYTTMGMQSGSTVYYAQYIIKNVDATSWLTNATTGVQVLALMFLMPALTKRFQKHLLYQIGGAILSVCFFVAALFPDTLPFLIAVNAIKGIGFAMTGSLMYGMCADSIDYGEWKTGISSAGLGAAMLQCMGKFGIALGTAILGWILSLGGFSATAASQTESGTSALIAVYTWVPAIALALIVMIMFTYRLDKDYDRIKAELRERNKV